MLATLVVNVNTDAASITDDGILRLREAIAYVNGTAPGPLDLAQINTTEPLGQNDKIVFDTSLNGDIITITGGSLVVTKRVTITGPTGAANRITIQKGAGSTATVGVRFQSFNLAPINVVPGDTGVFNLGISGFGTGIEAASLSSTNFDFECPLRITGNEITNNVTGILFDNSDVPFKIEGNRIVGTSPTAGLGITLTNSDQTVVNLPADYKPTIGNSDVGGGNAIGSFARIRGASSALWLAA